MYVGKDGILLEALRTKEEVYICINCYFLNITYRYYLEFIL